MLKSKKWNDNNNNYIPVTTATIYMLVLYYHTGLDFAALMVTQDRYNLQYFIMISTLVSFTLQEQASFPPRIHRKLTSLF